MLPRYRLSGLACGLALLVSAPLAAEPFFPEARTAMRAAKTVRIEVEQEFPNPATDMEEDSEMEEEGKLSPKSAPAPFLDIDLPLAKDAGELFQAMGIRPVADGPADLVLRVKAVGNPVSATYNMIGTQYAGAELSGRLTFLLDGRELADTDFAFTYDRPGVVFVTTFNGIPGGGPNSTPESAPFDRTLPSFYRAVLEFAGRGLGAEAVARVLVLPDPEMKAGACVALGDLAEPEALPALLKACDDPDAKVRAGAAWALGRLKAPAAIPALLAGLGKFDEFPEAKGRADDTGFGSSQPSHEEIEEERWEHYLAVHTDAPDEIFQRNFREQGFSRPYLLEALTESARDNAEGVRLLREALKADKPSFPHPLHLRSGAALVLGELKIGEAHDELIAGLSEGQHVKRAALAALGRQRDPRAVEPVLALLAQETAKKGPDDAQLSGVGEAATGALQSITGQYFGSVPEWRKWWRTNKERLLATPAK